jgi:hypothetical protein
MLKYRREEGLFMKWGVAFIALLLVSAVFAQEDDSASKPSAFTTLDLFFEKLNLWLTFDPAEKVRVGLAHAEERIAEGAVDQREHDLNLALETFEAYESTTERKTHLASEVRVALERQETLMNEDADAMRDQNALFLNALKEYPSPVVYVPIESSITGAVIVDDALSEELMSEVEVQDEIMADVETLESEDVGPVKANLTAESNIISDLQIVAWVQGGEITRINVTKDDFFKQIVLSITDYNATVKELSKRLNVTEYTVRKSMEWREN